MDKVLRPLFVLLWSTGYLAGTLGTASAPPLALTLWRFVLAGGLLAGVALATRAPWPRTTRGWVDAVVVGVLLQGVQFTGVYLGLAHGTSAALSALVISLCPLLVAVAARPLLGERFSGVQWIGSGIAVAGLLVAAADRLDGGGTGLVWTVLGLLGFAAGTLYQKRFGGAMDLRTGTSVQLIGAAAVMLPVTFLAGQGAALPHDAVGAGALVWLATVNSIGGMTVLFLLLRRGGGADTASLLYVVPPITAVLAVPVLGQPLTPSVLAGLALSGAGVLVVQRAALTHAGDQRVRRIAATAGRNPPNTAIIDALRPGSGRGGGPR